MRILVLNYEFPPLGGGASPVSYEIAKGLVKNSHHVDVVTMHYVGLPEFEVKEGINIYRVKSFRKYREICRTHEMLSYVLSAKNFLKKHLQNNNYDICHCHFIIPTGIVARWVKKKYGIPYVITAHGSDVPGYNPDRFQFQHKFTKPLIKTICRSASHLTTPSRYLSDLIMSEIDEKRTAIIPNGSQDYLRDSLSKEKIIVSSGRLLKRKGFHLLIQAFDELNPPDWKLYIVGDGPFGSELKSLSENPNIKFTGWLDNSGDEYVDLMNRASIFALLSSNESQGIVYVEAMSCGCAILSSNITACQETVTEDIGHRVSLADTVGIKRKLLELINDEEKRMCFMKNSRRRYLDHYQYVKIIDKYVRLFQLKASATDIFYSKREN